NGGNGNGINENPNENGRGDRPVARECTYHDFMKCQPLNFKGTKGVVRLTRSVMSAEPTRLQDAIRFANGLKDQKLKGYALKKMLKTKEGWRLIREKTMGKNHHSRGQMLEERMWQEPIRLATIRENRIMDRCLSATSVSFIMKGYALSDCPKLKDQNRRNKSRNKNGVDEARGKAYVMGGGDANPDSNVVKGTFLLNNHYDFVLFDSGVDRSFVSSTFSTLLDIILDTLDVSYAVELADGRVSKTKIVLRGCTLVQGDKG
nr:reverse transcriptase domain-containing protein [Tanacetum cinerariifolium]